MAKARPIYVLNGPNLNLLGLREPEIYGRTRLSDIEAAVVARAATHKLDVTFRQSNHEGMLVDWIQEARNEASGLILNAGAFTHTSVAILDALNTFEGPILEVHISNVHKREAFRHHSYVSTVASGVIAGFGTQGYLLALQRIARLLAEGAGGHG